MRDVRVWIREGRIEEDVYLENQERFAQILATGILATNDGIRGQLEY